VRFLPSAEPTALRRTPSSVFRSIPLILFAGFLALPVLAVLASWLPFSATGQGDAQAGAILLEMASTVLPGYVWTTLWLSMLVALGAAVVGTLAAAAVTLFDFPGRRTFEWLLLLPLAMPAYVTAYAYTDFLQFSGPLQVWLRESFGLEGRLLPEVRSLGGAVWVFIFSLYPYVYLLARTALGERAAHLMEAARLLGAPLSRRIRAVALPLARPAVAAGVALVLMETLADFGVASYFGIQTFTTGIYKAWLVMFDRDAAAQLASLLLLLVALLLWAKGRAQKRLRFAATRAGAMHAAEARAIELRGGRAALAVAACALPVLLGFVLPVAVLLRLVWLEAANAEFGLPLARFAQWAWTSFKLAGLAALLATAAALALGFALRLRESGALRAAARVVSLGYAVPGAVIAVGILLPVGWLQARFPQAGTTALVTGTLFGLMYAYLVRFSAVALQSVEAGLARVPHSIDDSARLLGARPWRVFVQLHVPLLRRAALACVPPGAHAEALACAHHVTAARGGEGAAREFCDKESGSGDDNRRLLEAQMGGAA